MSLVDEITKAIGAHGLWKQRLRNAIESGSSEFTVETVAKDNLCDFGKWLHGATMTAADKSSADYKSVLAGHAKFHQCAATVLSAALAGKRGDAEAMMGSAGNFTAASADLTRAMVAWKGKAGH